MTNIQFNDKTNFYTNKLFELFNLSLPCHFSSHSSGNTIDVFITSSFIKPTSILTHPVSFSDHHLMQPSFSTNPIKLSFTVKVSTRSWPQLDEKLFIQLFSASSFNSSFFTDVDDFVFALDFLFTNTLNVLLPIKSFNYHFSSFKAPWFDGKCVTSKRTLRKLERSYSSSPSSSFHVLLLSHLSTYRFLHHSKHSNFSISFINSYSSSARWKNFNRILSKRFPPPFFSRFSWLFPQPDSFH